MKRPFQLAWILCLSVAICSLASHGAVRFLRIKASWGSLKHYGQRETETKAILYCSSPGYDGVDWNRISEAIGGAIESWATPGSSPSEWEITPAMPPHGSCTLVAVSAHDLNEYFLCDFRADIVPLKKSIEDLKSSGVDWEFANRLLGQYPVMFVRKLFPTAGRSDGVMVGIRAKLAKLAGHDMEAGEAPKFAATENTEIEKISDWAQARLDRRLGLLRGACLGKFSSNGPKKQALKRLLERAELHGSVVLVVVPVSPLYRKALLPPSALRQFETELADVRRDCFGVQIIRLDQVVALDNNDLYYDYVHLNKYGQTTATESLLVQLKVLGIPR